MGKKRIYELEFDGGPETPILNCWFSDGSPVKFGDIGNRVRISGLIMQGEGTTLLLHLPTFDTEASAKYLYPAAPTLEEWGEIIRNSDDPKMFEAGALGLTKIIHRKVQFALSGGVQWVIWSRDKFRCMYCGKAAGPGVPLTVDHFVPLEMSGDVDSTNLLSSCRRCNKAKGARDPEEFCESRELDYEGLCLYLKGEATAAFVAHLA